ncbi:hypothetical protein Glove_203g61 [Diversispora epigaea]|uniref:Uncharacterized protein n=1 Tax=Diversispora epigaea TaxID=1348612 RepID=A0A397IPF6_9GLOM|nr:hypothetical protein Glove_203g61 [Diversispora epigaea]
MYQQKNDSLQTIGSVISNATEEFEEILKQIENHNDHILYSKSEIEEQVPNNYPVNIEEFFPLTNTITTTTPLDYKTHPQAIYTCRLLNFSSPSKPKNDENFEKELEELTKEHKFYFSKL